MQDIEQLLAKESIRDTLSRYCRGLDRMDKEMAYSVWHIDASTNYHGIYEGSGYGFIDWVWEAHTFMQCHSHQITNVLIDVDGDQAVSEAYITVVLWTLPDEDGKQTEIIGRGRYLDHWLKRDGSWRIARREFVQDMNTLNELTKGDVSTVSARDTSDASFLFLAAHSDATGQSFK